MADALPNGAGMLISVFVASRARGLGLGKKLSAAVIGQAKAEGLRELYLDVVDENAVARRMYERLGFHVTGRRCATEKQELEMRLAL